MGGGKIHATLNFPNLSVQKKKNITRPNACVRTSLRALSLFPSLPSGWRRNVISFPAAVATAVTICLPGKGGGGA